MVLPMKDYSRITVTLDNELLRRADSYWHRQELRNRNAAICELISLALDWAANEPDPRKAKEPKR